MKYLQKISLFAFFAMVAAGSLFAITPGVWCTDLNAAKNYAVQHKMPLFVFYGVDGCTYCSRGLTALNSTTFKNWMARRKIVMLNLHASEWKDDAAWRFASNNWQADLFPACRVWWPKNGSASSGVVGRAFVGRLNYSYVRAFSGTQLQDKLITVIESFIGSWKTPSSFVAPSATSSTTTKTTTTKTRTTKTTTTASTSKTTTTVATTASAVGSEWKKAHQLVGAVYERREIVGTCEVKCGKADKKGLAKVSAKLVLFTGRKISFKAQKINVSTGKLVLSWTKGDGLDLAISGTAVSGTAGSMSVSACTAGGEITGRHSLSLDGWSGDGDLAFNASGSKWAFPASADVYKSKLSYNSKKGSFKGKLKLKEEIDSDDDGEKVKTKKISLKVTGAVLDKGFFGYGTCKSFDTNIEGD